MRFLVAFFTAALACPYIQAGNGGPVVIGHRGMYLNAPENTLAGFRSCIDRGIGIETDVRTTKDGELILIHDETYGRTTDGPDVPVRQLSLSEVRKLDAGSWFGQEFKGQRVPALEEALKLVSKNRKVKVPVAVNIKDVDEKGEIKLVSLLKKYDLFDQAFCFDQTRECSQRLKALDKRIKIAQNVEKEKLDQVLEENFIDVFLIWFVPSEAEVKKLHDAGKIIVLNLGGPRKNGDNPSAFKEFLQSGADAILIDHPVEFYDYIKRLNINK